MTTRQKSQRQQNADTLKDKESPIQKIELPGDEVSQPTVKEVDELEESLGRQKHDIEVQQNNDPDIGLADALAKAVDQTPVVETPEKPEVQETKKIGNGVTLTSAKKPNGDIQMYLDSVDIEGFIRSKYKLEPKDYPLGLVQCVAGINAYINNMRNTVPVTPAEGLRHQMAWLRTVTAALDGQYDQAKACYDVILFTAHRFRNDLFNSRLAARFYNNMHADTQQLFLHVQSVIMGSCDPRGRAVFLQNTNLEKVAAKFTKPQVAQNFLAFYSEK